MLESVVREFIVIFVNSLTRDDIIIVACRRVWRVIGVCKQTKGGCYRGGDADYGGVGAGFNLMWETRLAQMKQVLLSIS